LVSQKQSRDQIATRVAELLSLVDLTEHADKYPAQLSGGEQQRVALVRALAPSPGLLLLDEPLSALDAKVRARLRCEIRAVQSRLGVTTIMVTHDQEEAQTIADRIFVMNAGQIEQMGAPSEIYDAPLSFFVADFIGVMNFFRLRSSTRRMLNAGAISSLAIPRDIYPDSLCRWRCALKISCLRTAKAMNRIASALSFRTLNRSAHSFASISTLSLWRVMKSASMFAKTWPRNCT
jgi:ABC-type Fe3+/spermidine/putrescine transport system ATPase subunit